ncbi:MAG: tryptophan-rich sensory protein [Lysobacterales bacterium]|jgi:tryptophan-rich sensory protein
MHNLVALGIFLLLAVIAAMAGGLFIGGEWYQQMQQPSWNPPALLMALLWGVYFVLVAVSAWMVWQSMRGLAAGALTLWGLLLLLGVVWSWTYFGLHRPGWALGPMSLWLAAGVLVLRAFRPIRPEAAWLMLPAVAWLAFSWLLNVVQWFKNGGGLGSIF